MGLLEIVPSLVTRTSSTDSLIVSVNDCGEWLNLSPDAIAAHTNLLTNLIKSTQIVISDYTWYDLSRRQYISYYEMRDQGFFFALAKLILTRSPILASTDITKIEWLDNNNIWQTFDMGSLIVDGLYTNAALRPELKGWASVYLNQSVNLSARFNVYRLRVTFNTGYDISVNNTVPEPLKLAIKKIVASLWTNRGEELLYTETIMGFPIPPDVRAIIDQYSVAKTTFNDNIADDYSLTGF